MEHCSTAGSDSNSKSKLGDLSSMLKLALFFRNNNKANQARRVYEMCISKYSQDFRPYYNLAVLQASGNA